MNGIHVLVNTYAERPERMHNLYNSVRDIATTITIIHGRYPEHPKLDEPPIPIPEHTPYHILQLDAPETTKANEGYKHAMRSGYKGYVFWIDADETITIKDPDDFRNAATATNADRILVGFKTLNGPRTPTNTWETPYSYRKRSRLFSLDGVLECRHNHYTHVLTRRDGTTIDLVDNNATRRFAYDKPTTLDLSHLATIHHDTLNRSRNRHTAKQTYITNRNQKNIEEL